LEQILGAGDQEALVGDLRAHLVEQIGVGLLEVGGALILVARIEDHSHSSAPFFQA
jgi:hypothetical protein